MNDTINTKEKNNDVKGITFLAIGIMTIVAAISGATFAYFQVTATNNNISGESAYSTNALTLNITHQTQSSVGTKKLIPQLSSGIETAANSTNNCIDGNGNAICKHYTLTVTNNTTNTFYLDGTMTLTAATMPNIRWRVCTGVNACGGSDANTTSVTSLGSTFPLAAGTSSSIHVVIWINETGSVQTDSGSFNATVTFTGYNSADKSQAGITSTIRS